MGALLSKGKLERLNELRRESGFHAALIAMPSATAVAAGPSAEGLAEAHLVQGSEIG
jgi:hypothetical protein